VFAALLPDAPNAGGELHSRSIQKLSDLITHRQANNSDSILREALASMGLPR